ncbi:hypothetical protein [Thermicanus aegyptius]|uniref:hypothetical protein n=1 Tax=Thermicanus aegyptius TaxID=94009 RepID=UPI00040F1258|nr:hypothetical protein [Thermicanus aegyptius]
MGLAAFNRQRRELAAKVREKEKSEKPVSKPAPVGGLNDFNDMTVAELKQYAADNGIDLGGATKKGDILAVIFATKGGEKDGGE